MRKIKRVIKILFFVVSALIALGLLMIVLLIFLFTGISKIKEYQARKEGWIIPRNLGKSDTYTEGKKIYLKDPMPETDWTDGYLFGPYISPAPFIEERTLQKCKIYYDFCEGTDIEQLVGIVLFRNRQVVGAFWMDGLNFRCNGRAITFTKKDSLLCLYAEE